MAIPLIGGLISTLPAIGNFLGTAGGGLLGAAALPYIPDIARGAYNNLLRPAAEFVDRNLLTPFNQWSHPEQNHQVAQLPRWLSPQEQYQQQFENTPERQAQKKLLEQYQQPMQPSFDAIRQKYLRQQDERINPSIMEQFNAMGAYGSPSARRAVNQSETELATNLAALEAEFNQRNNQNELSRLQALAGYLGNQQQLGLENQKAQAQQQQFGQTLASQNLGLASQANIAQQLNALKSDLADIEKQKAASANRIEAAKAGLYPERYNFSVRAGLGKDSPSSLLTQAAKGASSVLSPFAIKYLMGMMGLK